jgi:hypothetical protein
MFTGRNHIDGVAAKKLGSLLGEFNTNAFARNGVTNKDCSPVGRVGHRSAIGHALNQHFFTIEH